MKKINFLMSCAAAMALALSFTSCEFSEDNAIPRVVDEGVYTPEALTAAIEKGGTVELGYGASIELDQLVNVPGSLKLVGNAEAPATIVLGADAGFVISSDFVAQNVNFMVEDALNNPLVQLAAAELAEGQTAVYIKDITFDNVQVSSLDKALFYSAGKNYLIKNFTINNSIINVTNDITVFDFTKGSAAQNLTVSNSTLFAIPATSKAMYSSQGGQKITELDENATQSFNFLSSTIVDFAMNKNFFSHRQSNQKWLAYTLKNCIFVDCGKKGQTVRGINGGQAGTNPTWTVEGNAFQFMENDELVDSSDAESTGDANEPVVNSFQGVVEFGDFLTDGFKQSSTMAGDPRWLK